MPEKRPGRPRGARNAKPTREAVRSYYALLQQAADAGDTTAAGKLIELDLLERQGARCTTES